MKYSKSPFHEPNQCGFSILDFNHVEDLGSDKVNDVMDEVERKVAAKLELHLACDGCPDCIELFDKAMSVADSIEKWQNENPGKPLVEPGFFEAIAQKFLDS